MQSAHSSIEKFKVVYDKVKADTQFSRYQFGQLNSMINKDIVSRNYAQVDIDLLGASCQLGKPRETSCKLIDMYYDVLSAEHAINLFPSLLDESGGFENPLDPEDELCLLANMTEDTVRKTVDEFQKIDSKLAESSAPKEAAQGQSEIVSIDNFIYALQRLHDALIDLRWAIMEHDADLEEPEIEKYENIEDLIADLRSP